MSEYTEVKVSVLQIFNEIRRRIEEINTYPLLSSMLLVNHDVYSKIESGNDPHKPFARLGMYFPGSDYDVPYTMDFLEFGIALGIGHQDMTLVPYHDIANDDKKIAERIVQILIGLANGQIALLFTMIGDEWDGDTQALEIVYRRQLDGTMTPLATYPYFEDKSLSVDDLSTFFMANTSDIPTVKIHTPTLKLFLEGTDAVDNLYHRAPFQNKRTPLSYAAWSQSVQRYYDRKAEDFEHRINQLFGVNETLSWKDSFLRDYKNAVKYRHMSLISVVAIGAIVYYAHLFTMSQLLGTATLVALFIAFLIWKRQMLIEKAGVYLVIIAYGSVSVLLPSIISPRDISVIGWLVCAAVGVELFETIVVDCKYIFRRWQSKGHNLLQ